MSKFKNHNARLQLLEVKDLITARRNDYNDYNRDFRKHNAGVAKNRPAIILKKFNSNYFMVSFATTSSSKGIRKGSKKIMFKGKPFYFNPTDTFIFNKLLMWKNMQKKIGYIKDSKGFYALLNSSLKVGQISNKQNPNLLIRIIDALINEEYPVADKLIMKQFSNPSTEDIHKRKEIIAKHKDFINKKNH